MFLSILMTAVANYLPKEWDVGTFNLKLVGQSIGDNLNSPISLSEEGHLMGLSLQPVGCDATAG